jgi:hypothetical protein
MSLLGASQWLADTPWSIALHESLYGNPIVESIHVWALCLFVGLTVVLDLRLTGLTFKTVPVSEVVKRILPWQVLGFVIMVASGVLLFYAIPVRSYQNIFFRVKLVLLVLAGLNVWCFNSDVYRRFGSGIAIRGRLRTRASPGSRRSRCGSSSSSADG